MRRSVFLLFSLQEEGQLADVTAVRSMGKRRPSLTLDCAVSPNEMTRENSSRTRPVASTAQRSTGRDSFLRRANVQNLSIVRRETGNGSHRTSEAKRSTQVRGKNTIGT